jgi:hypothetical protein
VVVVVVVLVVLVVVVVVVEVVVVAVVVAVVVEVVVVEVAVVVVVVAVTAVEALTREITAEPRSRTLDVQRDHFVDLSDEFKPDNVSKSNQCNLCAGSVRATT